MFNAKHGWWVAAVAVFGGLLGLFHAHGLRAQAGEADAVAAGIVSDLTAQMASAPAVPASVPLPMPRPPIALPSSGRLTRQQVGVVINEADPYSVSVGAYYVQQRGLRPHQVLRVQLPVGPALSPDDLQTLRQQIDAFFGPGIQALALAWAQPWRVECNSITSAVTLGFQPGHCGCGKGTDSPYFNATTAMPFSVLGIRPSMLLAASDVAHARALIDTGVSADGSRFHVRTPMVAAVFKRSGDVRRDVRAPLFPQPNRSEALGVEIRNDKPSTPVPTQPLILYQTGGVNEPQLAQLKFVPGAVADHLTSAGGMLDGSGGHMPATAWIDAGATASYGTVTEPCNYTQKFPHPQLLLLRLMEGGSVLEAYWKSVQWPVQGVFVGEPLAAPYAPVQRPVPAQAR